MNKNLSLELSVIKMFYSFHLNAPLAKPLAIYTMDSTIVRTGLADRFRGMISVYAWAKMHNKPFRILHHNPFTLEDYFVPNKYDWTIKDGELVHNLRDANPISILDKTKGYRYFFLAPWRQHHFYTNVDALPLFNKYFHTDFKYSELFSELFKPSPKLENALIPYKQFIENGYVSISFRFINLLGDFEDTVHVEPLDEDNKKKLIESCIKQIYRVREMHPQYDKVLVTSDSESFNKEASKLDFVLMLEGAVGHIACVNGEQADSVTMRTFLDFYMISQAKHAYMAHTGKMYKSNFARSASMSTGIPYETISF